MKFTTLRIGETFQTHGAGNIIILNMYHDLQTQNLFLYI